MAQQVFERRKQELQKKIFHPRRPNAEEILQYFTSDSPSGAVCIFRGKRHLYLYGLFSMQEELASKKKFVCVTEGKPVDGLEQLKVLTDGFEDSVGRLLDKYASLKNEDDLKKIGTWLIGKDSLVLGDEPIREINSDVAPENFTEQDADAYNECFLRQGGDLWKKIFPKKFLPQNLDSIYLITNQYQLQKIPFSMLPISEIKSERGELCYRDIQFMGTEFQVANMGSLHELYQIRQREKGKLTKSGVDPQLSFVGICNTRRLKKGKDRIDDVITNGPGHIGKINSILTTNKKSLVGSTILFPKEASHTNNKQKLKILRESRSALLVYFYGHLPYERRKNGLKKILLHGQPKFTRPYKKKRPWYKALDRYPNHIYNEEIKDNDNRATYVVFINGCGSWEGEERTGFLPLSISSSYLAGGVQAVIGTRTRVAAYPAAYYGELFSDIWSGKGSKTLGLALLETNRKMLNPTNSHNKPFSTVHPINWGGYTLMGDLTMSLDSILEVLPPFPEHELPDS